MSVCVYACASACVCVVMSAALKCVCAGNHMPQHNYGGNVGVSLHLPVWLRQEPLWFTNIGHMLVGPCFW